MNMGYCRFENTLIDLEDVYEHIEDVLSRNEHEAREELIRLCTTIARQAKNYNLVCEDDEEIDEEDEENEGDE